MSKKKDEKLSEQDSPETETRQEAAETDNQQEAAPLTDEDIKNLAAAAAAYAEEHDRYLRLAAEYDNYRKRTAKERESLYADAKADTIGRFLPVYDNLERALKQETADEAYKKGVEMTMTGLREIMDKLGVKEFGENGEAFDPERHSAVMHIDDPDSDESVIAEVFQKGFSVGDKVVRFAMVKVAN